MDFILSPSLTLKAPEQFLPVASCNKPYSHILPVDHMGISYCIFSTWKSAFFLTRHNYFSDFPRFPLSLLVSSWDSCFQLSHISEEKYSFFVFTSKRKNPSKPSEKSHFWKFKKKNFFWNRKSVGKPLSFRLFENVFGAGDISIKK